MRYQIQITGRYGDRELNIKELEQVIISTFRNLTGEDVIVSNNSPAPTTAQRRRYPNRMKSQPRLDG